MIDLAQPELKCKFNPMGICCDGHTLCSYCGWNPQEVERRKRRIRALVNSGRMPRLAVKQNDLQSSVVGLARQEALTDDDME